MAKKARTREHPLGLLLAPKRRLIRPESLGLPKRAAGRPGPKAEGLTQSHMDILLNRAQRTYNRFERGQLPNPPDDFLVAVGRLLKLTPDEYTMMWLHARGHRPTHPLETPVGLHAPDLWQEACDGMGHMMYVTDLAWNMYAHNTAFADMFIGGKAPQNTARWMLLTEEGRTTLMDWETTWAPSLSAQLQAALAEHPDSEELRQIDADVRADPVAGPIYRSGAAPSIAPDGVVRRLRHPLHGPGVAKMVAATPIASPGARMIIVIFEPEVASAARATSVHVTATGTPVRDMWSSSQRPTTVS
ncbi:XRE family transcriptional regulator [Streptomyces sp. NPDC097610]|uniref:MmyB family transcriptional regulator n=1 Tax=Streptomyces sp. NPDC097610 TaxID=3157227 RepID=UPI00333489FC